MAVSGDDDGDAVPEDSATEGKSTEGKGSEKKAKKEKYGELLRGSELRVKNIDDEIARCNEELRKVRERRSKRDERLKEMRELQRQYQAHRDKSRAAFQKQRTAAVYIQKLVRGYFIRKYFRLTVTTSKELQQLQCQRRDLNVQLQGLRHCVHNLEFVEDDKAAAAVKIQAWWRGNLGRHLVKVLHVHRRVFDQMEEMEHAATRLQAKVRGHNARKAYRSMEQEVAEAAQKRALMEVEMNNRSVLTIQRATRGYLGRKEAMRRRDAARREMEKGDEEPSNSKKLPNRGVQGDPRAERGGDTGDGGRSHRDDRAAIQWGGRENHAVKGGGTPRQGKNRDKSSEDKSKAGGSKPAKRHSSRTSKRVGGELLDQDASESSDGEEHLDRVGSGAGAGDRGSSRKGRGRKSNKRKVKRGSTSRGSPDRDVRDDDHAGGPSPPPRDNFETHMGGEPERSIAAVSVLAASLFDVTLQKAAVELGQLASGTPKELPMLASENSDMLLPNPRFKEVATRLFEPHF